MKNEKITIYTDGSARGNPGKAGWGVVFISGDKVWEMGGRSEHATNNQMELTAAIEALRHVKKSSGARGATSKETTARNGAENPTVEIFSDSKYVILGVTEWIHGWIKNGWRNAAKKPVLNRELWEELHELNKEVKPKWSYVAGHADSVYNNRADEIATSYADNLPMKLKT
ncbi:MAG TPA: ribonuclease H [Candidatus Paceibacterota bacterium]|nr:ribonuclease H [Candidatus Paceibacterota bacterium]